MHRRGCTNLLHQHHQHQYHLLPHVSPSPFSSNHVLDYPPVLSISWLCNVTPGDGSSKAKAGKSCFTIRHGHQKTQDATYWSVSLRSSWHFSSPQERVPKAVRIGVAPYTDGCSGRQFLTYASKANRACHPSLITTDVRFANLFICHACTRPAQGVPRQR